MSRSRLTARVPQTLAIIAVAMAAAPGTAVASSGATGSLSFSPPSVDFGAQAIGFGTPDVSVDLINSGSSGVTVTSVGLSGATASFQSDSGSCSGATLPPNSACQVNLYFVPQIYGQSSGTLTVTTTGGTKTAHLSGIGVVAPPISYFFGGKGSVRHTHITGGAGGGPGPGPGPVGGITAASDGGIWFTNFSGIGRIDPSTTIETFFSLNNANIAYEMAAGHGPQSNSVWFSEDTSVGTMNTSGGPVTDYAIPPLPGPNPPPPGARGGVLVDPNGIVWVAETGANVIGRLDPLANNGAGAWTAYAIPTATSGPAELARDPSGNLWFSEGFAGKIGELSPKGTPQFHEFTIPPGARNVLQSRPAGLFVDAAGNVWAAEPAGNRIEELTPGANPTWREYDLSTTSASPDMLTLAPGASGFLNFFFTEQNANKIGKLVVNSATHSGTISEYSIPGLNGRFGSPQGITLGPDSNIWFIDNGPERFGLTGSAVVAPVGGVSLSTMQYADQAMGSRGDGVQDFVLNTGTADLHVGAVTITGPDASAFTVRVNGCQEVTVLPPFSAPGGKGRGGGGGGGSTCAVLVEFHPTAARAYAATMRLVTDAGITPLTTALLGTGKLHDNFRLFSTPTSVAGPVSITTDGTNVWFTESGQAQIGRSTSGGAITEFPVPGIDPRNCQFFGPPGFGFGGCLGGITLGSDHNIWFTVTNYQNGLARITPAGVITEFPTQFGSPSAIITGPNGDLFTTDQFSNDITEFSTSGQQLHQWFLPAPKGVFYQLTSIASGPSGDLWVTAAGSKFGPPGPPAPDLIASLNPATGVFTEFNIRTPFSGATSIVATSSNALWFAEPFANQLGIVHATGPSTASITEIPIPASDASPTGLALGSDGNIWLTEDGTSKIGRVMLSGANCPRHCFNDYSLPGRDLGTVAITALGASLWFVNATGSSLGEGPVSQPPGS